MRCTSAWAASAWLLVSALLQCGGGLGIAHWPQPPGLSPVPLKTVQYGTVRYRQDSLSNAQSFLAAVFTRARRVPWRDVICPRAHTCAARSLSITRLCFQTTPPITARKTIPPLSIKLITPRLRMHPPALQPAVPRRTPLAPISAPVPADLAEQSLRPGPWRCRRRRIAQRRARLVLAPERLLPLPLSLPALHLGV